MAERSGFFNAVLTESGEYDRRYLAQDFADYFASFIGNGVFPNPSTGLQVMAGSGMQVILRKGQGWINGYWYENTDDLLLDLSPASGTLGRIDAIMLRWSSSDRRIKAAVKEGVLALSPIAQPVQRDADMWELCLAYAKVARNQIQIVQSNIDDNRLKPALCGLVTGVVTQIDTTTLGNQLQTFINEYMQKYDVDYGAFLEFIEGLKVLCNKAYAEFLSFILGLRNLAQLDYDSFTEYTSTLHSDSTSVYTSFISWLNAYKVTAQQEFEAWVETIKGILDEEAEGHILNEIDKLWAILPSVMLGTIEHNLNRYPKCTVYKTTWAGGAGGAGLGPAGGTSLIKIEAGVEHLDRNRVAISAPAEFSALTVLKKIEFSHEQIAYAFVPQQYDIDVRSLLVTME